MKPPAMSASDRLRKARIAVISPSSPRKPRTRPSMLLIAMLGLAALVYAGGAFAERTVYTFKSGACATWGYDTETLQTSGPYKGLYKCGCFSPIVQGTLNRVVWNVVNHRVDPGGVKVGDARNVRDATKVRDARAARAIHEGTDCATGDERGCIRRPR